MYRYRGSSDFSVGHEQFLCIYNETFATCFAVPVLARLSFTQLTIIYAFPKNFLIYNNHISNKGKFYANQPSI